MMPARRPSTYSGLGFKLPGRKDLSDAGRGFAGQIVMSRRQFCSTRCPMKSRKKITPVALEGSSCMLAAADLKAR